MERRRPNSSKSSTPLRRSTRLWKTDFVASRLKELCNYCKLIKIRDFTSNETLYQRTRKETSQSVEEGCTLCRFLNQCFANPGDYAQKHPNAVWSLSISQREEAYGHNKRPTQVTLNLNHQETPFKYEIADYQARGKVRSSRTL